jgi:hypothetical protein
MQTYGQAHRRQLLGQPLSHRRKSCRPMGERIGKNYSAKNCHKPHWPYGRAHQQGHMGKRTGGNYSASHFRIGASHGDLWASASAKTPQPDIFTSRTGHMDERTGGNYSAEHCRMDGWQKRPAALARRQQRPATMANRSAPAHRGYLVISLVGCSRLFFFFFCGIW